MPLTSVTLSATTGASPPIQLNWRGGRPVMWAVTTGSSVAIGDFTVQYTLQDPMLFGYSSQYAPTGSATYATSAWWFNVSSTPYTTVPSGAGTHFTSSTIWPDGIVGTFMAPPAAIRLFSTANTSNALVLSIVQADGG